MNESKEQELIGRYVEFYLVGGHIVSGEIKLVDKNKICLEDKERAYLIYRDKISGIWMNALPDNVSKTIEQITPQEYNQGVELEEEDSFPENHIGIGGESQLSLPSDILIPGTIDDDSDLGISFVRTDTSSNLNVVLVKDDKQNSGSANENRKNSKTNS